MQETKERKPAAIAIAILAAIVAAWGTRQVIDWIRREPAVDAAVIEQPWVAQSLAGGRFTFEAPWALPPTDLGFPPELRATMRQVETVGRDGDGLQVMATYMAVAEGGGVSLDGAVQGMEANLRAVPGTASVTMSRQEARVAGLPAAEVNALIERERGVPLRARCLLVASSGELFQLLTIHRADQAAGGRFWERLRASARISGVG